MKQLLLCSFLFTGSFIYAQQNHAVITTKTVVVAPEGDDVMPTLPPSVNGEEVKVVRFGGEGETKSVTWVKNDLIKTLVTNDMGRTTTIRDNSKKITTTLMEMMGTKRGFYATDEDQQQMDKSMDSLMKTRQQSMTAVTVTNTAVANTDETKKIAGFNCKKAYIINTRSNGKTDSSTVWYTPDVKLPGINYTGGMGGMFGRNTAPKGFDKVDGFIMSYAVTMNRGRKMTVEVTKLETDKDVADKEFEISKDFDVKPLKDMQNGGGLGSFQIKIGG